MPDDRGLRVLMQACDETLAEARAGQAWFRDMVTVLERLCGRLAAQSEAQT